MSFLNAKDTISGQEGTAYARINGNREELFYIKKLEAKVEKEKSEIKTIGRRGTQHKAKGWKGTGTLTIYKVTSLYNKLMEDYAKNGTDTYFDLVVSNQDPTSSIGTQTITLTGVNLDSVTLALLDTESDALEEDIDFTFEGFNIDQSFNKPILG